MPAVVVACSDIIIVVVVIINNESSSYFYHCNFLYHHNKFKTKVENKPSFIIHSQQGSLFLLKFEFLPGRWVHR